MSNRAKDASTSPAPKPRSTVAKSITTPVSNTRRKIVYVKDSSEAQDPVEESVALLPVRYAVAPREKEDAYRYTAGGLNCELPALKKTKYVLRSLRRGFVYLYAQQRLHGFEVTAGGNLRAFGYLPSRGDTAASLHEVLLDRSALLIPKRYSKVDLAYSEHAWTKQFCQKVEGNQDNARTCTMQSFSLEKPQADAFALDQLDTQVEDFAGRADEYDWSDTQATARDATAYARLEKTATGGQHVVALADPTGISHDLTALVEDALNDIKHFVSNPDAPEQPAADATTDGEASPTAGGAPAQMPVLAQPAAPPAAGTADTADPHRVRYRKKLIAECIGQLYESHVKLGVEANKLAAMRLEHWKNEPANKNKEPPSLDELHRDVVTSPSVSPTVGRWIKHIDEDARRAFLTDYDQQVAALRKIFESRRLDRLAWLNTWNKEGDPQSLHADWQTYDTTASQEEWQHFEHTHARCIAGLLMDNSAPNAKADTLSGAQKDEWDLVDKIIKAPYEQNPMYLAIAGYNELRAAAETIDTSSYDKPKKPISGAPDRSGATMDGLANAIDDIYHNFRYTIGTEVHTHVITAYTLLKSDKWRGAVVKNIDDFLVKLTDNADSAAVIKTLMARYGENVSVKKLDSIEYSKWFVEAAGDPPGLADDMDELIKSGTLKADNAVVLERHQTTAKRQSLFGNGPDNPFRGWGTVGVSAFVGMLYLWNLKMAVARFDKEDGEQYANLGSAIAAIGSGVNAGLIAFKKATPHAMGMLYRRVPGLEQLAGKLALRLFGYGGAFLTGATLGIQGSKLIKKGDTDAGLWYAASALTATAGGSALTYVSGAAFAGTATLLLTPLGWFVLGAVLVGGSIYFSMSGDDAKDTPVELWLDACTFGKQAREDTAPFPSLPEEIDALRNALFIPQLIDTDWQERWGFPHYKGEAKIFVRGYRAGKSKVRVFANGAPIGMPKREYVADGMVADLAHYVRKDEANKLTVEVQFQPTKDIGEPYILTFTLPNELAEAERDDEAVPGP